MRQTLIEVLGSEQGSSMYSFEWLRERVLWHLNPDQTDAKIFLSQSENGEVTGHAIARIELDDETKKFGYFSTIFVCPEARRQGIATKLMNKVEKWFADARPETMYAPL